MPARSDSVLLQAWCPPDLAADVRAHAEANERSASAEIRRALKHYLKSEAAGQGDLAKTGGADADACTS